MKKRAYLTTAILIAAALILTACDLPSNTGDLDNNTAETLVALAFTQTAIAEFETAEQQPTEAPVTPAETEPPSATATPTVTPTEIVHEITPGEPGFVNKWFYDTNSSNGASTGGVTGGDDYVANLFERPFTEGDMAYRPDLDINKTEISSGDNFIYTTIFVNGEHPQEGLPGAYGVEIDWDRDGRGDLLVMVKNPNESTWDISGVSVHRDTNKDVGGSTVMRPDSNYQGDSYEETIFSSEILDDPDTAWARWSPGENPVVTLAFKKSLISGNGTFVWGVWAAENLLASENMDLHDRHSQSEAGSPYPSRSNYPLAAINQVDNTCRETFGFEPTIGIPGLCAIPEEEDEEEPIPDDPEEEGLPGSLIGSAFDDWDNDGTRDSDEPDTVYDVTITVHNETCANPAIGSSTDKFFNFSGLGPGMICVQITQPGPMTTPSQYTVEITPGGSAYVDFGFESPE